MFAVNDALADQIVRASVAGGPLAVGRYLPFTGGPHFPAPALIGRPAISLAAIRALPGRIASLFATPAEPICCPTA